MFVQSVSSEPEQLSSWRTEEIFVQTVSSHLSELFSVRPWHPGALAQTQDNGVLLCYVCVCVCVWVMLEWAEVGRERAKQGGQVKDTPLSVFPNPFLQTSSSNRFRVPPLQRPPSLLCHTPCAGVSSSLFLPLPPLFPPSIELKKPECLVLIRQ